MTRRLLRAAAGRLAALAAVAVLAGCAAPPPAAPVQVKVLAINDFHGHLKLPPGGFVSEVRRVAVRSGGVEHLATAVAQLRALNPNHAFVAAGDLVGGSPLLSSLLHDEPAIEVLNAIGLEASVVGNHDFDHGRAELLRLQNGGCHPKTGCQGPTPFRGATFRFLSANTIDEASGRPLLPPYWIKRFQGIPVAFVGASLMSTPMMTSPSAVAGLSFRDEADSLNALVPELRRQGIEAIVALVHEGGLPTGDFNECPSLQGRIVDLVRRLDPAIDVVVSGHTHRAYNCRIDGRVVTSAGRWGTVLTQIDLTLDPRTRDVISVQAENMLVTPERFPADPVLTARVAAYESRIGPLAQRKIGRLTRPLPARPPENQESPLGRVIADAQLEATRAAGAQLALMNPGGVRARLGSEEQLDFNYEELHRVQPFGNQLVTLTLTGAEIVEALEQQWSGASYPRVLSVSAGFAYRWDARRPPGQRVVPGSVQLDGQPLDAARRYRVTVNSFLADGGDSFAAFAKGRERRVGAVDLDALVAYFESRPVFTPDLRPRVLNAP